VIFQLKAFYSLETGHRIREDDDSRSKIKVKCHQLSTTSSVNHGTYFYQITSISAQQFLGFCADRETDTDTASNNTCWHAGNQTVERQLYDPKYIYSKLVYVKYHFVHVYRGNTVVSDYYRQQAIPTEKGKISHISLRKYKPIQQD